MFEFNYTSKKEVKKRDPNQPCILTYFELLYRKKWELFKINILYLLTLLPTFIISFLIMGLFSTPIANVAVNMLSGINFFNVDAIIRIYFSLLFILFFGQGPTTAGITYIIRNYIKEEHSWIMSDWWEHSKKNFKQAIFVWMIDIIFVPLFLISMMFYMSSSGPMKLGCFIMMFIILNWILVHFYIYQYMIMFKDSILNIFKNSWILAMQNIFKNLILFLMVVCLHIFIPIAGIMSGWNIFSWIIFLLAELIILPSVTLFTINFFVYPQIEMYIHNSNNI